MANKKIIFKSILLSLCFDIMLSGCNLNHNKNGIYGNGIDYVEEEKSSTENLVINSHGISGVIADQIKVNISNPVSPENAAMIKYNPIKYNPDIIKDLFFNDDKIESEEFFEDTVFTEYLSGGISSETATSIITPDEMYYATQNVLDKDLVSVLESESTTVRKDISEVFCKPVEDEKNISLYEDKTKQILSKMEIDYANSPAFYYIDKQTLAKENTVCDDREIDFDSDYILVLYDHFTIDGIPVYNDYVKWMNAGEWSESSAVFLFNVKNDELEYLKLTNMYDSASIKKENECTVINVEDALSVAAHFFDKSNPFNDIFISDTKLSYVPIYENRRMCYVPSWVFSFSSYDSENKKNVLRKNVFINAFNGKVMI